LLFRSRHTKRLASWYLTQCSQRTPQFNQPRQTPPRAEGALRRRAVDISINAFTMECVYLGVSPRYTTPLLHNACQRARGRCPRRKDAARIVDLAGCAAVHAGRYRTNAKPRPSLQPTGRARLMNRAGNGYPPRSRTSGRRRCASNDVGPDVGTTRQPPVVKVTPGVTAHRD
jgi:hypothetical protein